MSLAKLKLHLKKNMENLNKNLLVVVAIEVLLLFIMKFPMWSYFVTVINIIAIVFLLIYKPIYYKITIIGLALLFIIPVSVVLYLLSKFQC